MMVLFLYIAASTRLYREYPAEPPTPCDSLEMLIALGRRSLARNGRRSRRDDDSGLGFGRDRRHRPSYAHFMHQRQPRAFFAPKSFLAIILVVALAVVLPVITVVLQFGGVHLVQYDAGERVEG